MSKAINEKFRYKIEEMNKKLAAKDARIAMKHDEVMNVVNTTIAEENTRITQMKQKKLK